MLLYPFWIRLWHLVNALLILILIFTGISLYYPEKVDSFFIIDQLTAAKWHKVASVILIVSYIGFITGNIFTDNGKYYRIRRKNLFRDLRKQMYWNFIGIFKHEKKPFPVTEESKFNPLQRISYSIMMYLITPLVILTGICLFPGLLPEDESGATAYNVIDIIHIVTACLTALFLIVHLVMITTLGSKPSSGFRSIISGYAESEE